MEALINEYGKEKDFESGLYDFGFRKYSEETGRFLSVDPLWEKYPGWNPYHYCMNNPVMAKDPGGAGVGY
jgi:RHS repeat-associated protein